MPEEIETIEEPVEQISTTYTPPSDQIARWYFDYSRLYWEIKAHLYGGWLEEDKNGNYLMKKPKNANPFLNTKGIEDTMALVNSFITKIQALTILDEERILTLCRDLYIKLAQLYYVNMEKYELIPEKASVVIRIVMNAFETNLRKSLGGRSLLLIGQTERIVEQKVEAPRKKIFGII
jgi:hypothetical protein